MWWHRWREWHLAHHLRRHRAVGNLPSGRVLLMVLRVMIVRAGHRHSLHHVLLPVEAVGPIGLIDDIKGLTRTGTTAADLILALHTRSRRRSACDNGRHTHRLRMLLHVMMLSAMGRMVR